MLRKTLLLVLCCGLTAGVLGEATPASAASKKRKKKAQTEQTAAKPKPTEYEKLFKEKHETADGMIRLHKVKGKLYFEFPVALLGRDMLLGSTVSEISDNGDAVIGGPNVTSLEDLAGKTVAYSAGTSSEVILTNALNSVGLTMDDINAMNMDSSAIVTAMMTGDVDACALWSPESLTVLEQVEGTTVLADNVTFSDTSISLASWIAMPDRVESERDMFVRFVTALFEGMDYSADEHYDEVAQWVADLLAIDYESAYNQRGDAEWLTGKEVYDGIADGTVAGYYELQQEIMISSGNLEAEVPVEDYVAFDIMTEAGDALYGEAAA